MQVMSVIIMSDNVGVCLEISPRVCQTNKKMQLQSFPTIITGGGTGTATETINRVIKTNLDFH